RAGSPRFSSTSLALTDQFADGLAEALVRLRPVHRHGPARLIIVKDVARRANHARAHRGLRLLFDLARPFAAAKTLLEGGLVHAELAGERRQVVERKTLAARTRARVD